MHSSQTPIYGLKTVILERCREMAAGVLLVAAPTGSGKTTAFREFVREHPEIFGSASMIQPTRMASESLGAEKIRMITPIQMLEFYFKTRHFGCRTLIIDEVHTRTEEYETILRILSRHRDTLRIILLTATPDLEFLTRYFPDLDTISLPISTPFPLDIRYMPPGHPTSFPTHRTMIPDVRRILEQNPDHKKVLVFVYTREQVDKMAREMACFAKNSGFGETRGLYGGFTKEEFAEWQLFLKKNDRFLVFATNVAETSITIPDVSLVIDFGVRCVQRNHRVVYDHCPRSNLIQRAGRTGRTCPGVVIRMMTEQNYESRPFQKSPEYTWDLLMVRMLRHHLDPRLFLPPEVDVDRILDRFRFYRLLSDTNRLNEPMSRFIVQSPLLFKNSCRLYQLLSGPHDLRTLLLFATALSMIDLYEASMPRIYYFSPELRLNKTRFLEILTRIFVNRWDDELELHLNIYLTCILSENPLDASNQFSLNFRSIRQISAHIHRVVDFVCHHQRRPKVDWKAALRNEVEWTRKNSFLKKNVAVCHLSRVSMDIIQTRFLHQHSIPQIRRANDLLFRPNLFAESHSCLLPLLREGGINKNDGLFVFAMDDKDLSDDWSSLAIPFPEAVEMMVFMYTRLPSALVSYEATLSETLQEEHRTRLSFRQDIAVAKSIFENVLEDVREDVAYRPSQEGFRRELDAFYRLLSLYRLR